MVERGILEVDAAGAYRLKPRPVNDSSPRCWVSAADRRNAPQEREKFCGPATQKGDTESFYDSF